MCFVPSSRLSVSSVDPVDDLDPVRLSADQVTFDEVEISGVRIFRLAEMEA